MIKKQPPCNPNSRVAFDMWLADNTSYPDVLARIPGVILQDLCEVYLSQCRLTVELEWEWDGAGGNKKASCFLGVFQIVVAHRTPKSEYYLYLNGHPQDRTQPEQPHPNLEAAKQAAKEWCESVVNGEISGEDTKGSET